MQIDLPSAPVNHLVAAGIILPHLPELLIVCKVIFPDMQKENKKQKFTSSFTKTDNKQLRNTKNRIN